MSHNVDFKIVLLGQAYCGKTSIVERFLNNKIVVDEKQKYQNTIGAAYGAKKMCIFGRRVTIGIWDTAGSERYEAIGKLYCREFLRIERDFKSKVWKNEIFWVSSFNNSVKNVVNTVNTQIPHKKCGAAD